MSTEVHMEKTTEAAEADEYTPPPRVSLRVKFTSAGLAACIADLITFPLDTTKVRIQIRNTDGPMSAGARSIVGGAIVKRSGPGLLDTMRGIVVKEGPRALYSGIVPGLQRQLCFASIRIGFYDDVKDLYRTLAGLGYVFRGLGSAVTQPISNQVDSITIADKKTKSDHLIRILAGLSTGALCVTLAQPTDVVKVRMQAQGSGGGAPRYSGVVQAYTSIAKHEGVKGLWKGYYPNVVRNSLINVSEVVTYDVIKETVLRHKLFDENVICHVFCGVASGLCATLIASPIDVIKTRYMNSPKGQYTGAIDCGVQMIKRNGVMACYKGFVPSFIRLGSWNVLMFVLYEQLKGYMSKTPPDMTEDVGYGD